MKTLFGRFSLSAVSAGTGTVLLLTGAAWAVTGASEPKAVVPTTPAVTAVTTSSDRPEPPPSVRGLSPGRSFAPVVRKVAPSVVKISTVSKAAPQARVRMDPRLRRFFGDELPFVDPRSPGGRNSQPRAQGVGSGVIVSKEGYLLTNNHVIDGADEVKVTLQDGREFTAKVVGKDPKTDVAVIRIMGDDLPVADLADSDRLEIGDVVLAVGNPFGMGQSVTMGIVSATGRTTGGMANFGLDYEDFIQTDAAINPGNSGGALVDDSGRLVGINTAILSRSGGNQGVGFAIPVNLARSIMDSLIKDGKVVRGYLGVMIQDLTPGLAREFKLTDRNGALVGDVLAGGPADKAGLRSGDLVTEWNGKPVRDSQQLRLSVAGTKPGSKIPVKILREGTRKSFEVTVRELPGTDVASRKSATDEPTDDALSGVSVTDLDPATRQQFNIPAKIAGALINGVEEGTAAAEAGLRAGDVIQEINRQVVRNAADAVRLTENPKDRTTLVRVWSQGNSRYVVVDEESSRG